LEVATLLLNIYHTTKNEVFKTSAAVSISHICKLNTTLFPTIFESLTCKQFSAALLDGPPRIQQAFITMLNIALTQPYAKLNDTLQDDENFILAISKMLENQSIVLRGKCLLTFLLLFKMNMQWFVIAMQFEFYKNLDKLLRDNFKYVQCCLLCLIENVSQMVPQMLQYMNEAFNKYLAGQSIGEEAVIKTKNLLKVVNAQKSEFSSLRGGLLMTLPFLEMMNSSAFKAKICRPQFVQILSQMI
jgi:hypothetical protein